MTRQITTYENYYRIAFSYSPMIVSAVKEIPGRRFDPISKSWIVPLVSKGAVEAFAKRFGFQWGATQRAEEVGEIPPLPELGIDIPLGIDLFPYQKQGVAYCLEHPRTIIGDKPGLGKTAQAIASVIGAQRYPCLIICPATLKINWQREVDKFSGGKCRAMILSDKNMRTWPQYWSAGLVQFFIVNYESLKKYFVDKFTNKEGQRLMLSHIKFKENLTDLFKSVIIDESHRCKNGSTQQSKFCMGIARGKDMVLLLTGTPVVNKPKDLIPQLHIMDMLPEFGGYKHFVNRYCAGDKEASNLRELNYKLNLNCFYQREKQDVLKDLPSKMRQTIICDITNRKEYTDAYDNLIRYLKEYRNADDDKIRKAMRGEVIVRINVLRQIAARGKVASVREFIDDLRESNEKLILFMNLIELGDAFKQLYPNAVVIRGGMSDIEKQRSVDKFQNDPDCLLAICNIKAAGVGLTLTASSRVAFVEFPWTYADCEQCEDRAHRIGQKDSVTCYYFLGKDTIDEQVYKIIQTKKDIAQTITGSTEQIEESVVDDIINLFTNH